MKCVRVSVCACAELYTLYMSDKMSELQIICTGKNSLFPLEEN